MSQTIGCCGASWTEVGRSGRADGAAEIEINECAFAAADPVVLHDANFFGPTL